MAQVISDFKDEVGEAVRDVVKIAKKQITEPAPAKPIPSKKVLTALQKATASLAQVRLKKVREELARQRLKTTPPASVSPMADSGEAKKPEDDIVAKTLKSSKSTGEFKGLIGG